MENLTDAQKEELEGVFDFLHEMFGRNVTYYKKPEEVIIQSNPDHNFLFEGAPDNTEVEIIQESGVFSARVLWGRKQDSSILEDTKTILQEGECSLKVDLSGHSILAEAERIVVDDIPCEKNFPARPHGLFKPKYYTYILKRVN